MSPGRRPPFARYTPGRSAVTADNTMYGSRSTSSSLPDQEMRPLRGGTLTLDFANTVDAYADDRDHFSPGYANVLTWYLHADLLDARESTRLLRLARRNPKDAATTRRRIAGFRDVLRATVLALCHGDPPATADLAVLDAERLEAEHHGHYLPAGDHLAWAFDESPELDRIIWPIAREAARFLSGGNMSRVRECASETCEWLFLDTSKNGSRRFCNPSTCGGATRVRRFRERQREPAAR